MFFGRYIESCGAVRGNRNVVADTSNGLCHSGRVGGVKIGQLGLTFAICTLVITAQVYGNRPGYRNLAVRIFWFLGRPGIFYVSFT
jgi:hypothetical protein